MTKIDTLDKVKSAIDLINLQGEGLNASPEEAPGDLAHYYRFAEIYHGKKLVQDQATGKWTFTGADVPLPDVWPMADIPPGGYQQGDVPDVGIWDTIIQFDKDYSAMLKALESAWRHGDSGSLDTAIEFMRDMSRNGTALVKKPKPDGSCNYGPCFRFIP